jgi:hypothetical protein
MSWENWLALGTNVAVFLGLLLVVLELNQNSELARVELINEGNAIENELWQSLMDQVPKDAIAKSIECPKKLDLSDYVVLDSYLYTAMNLVYRNYELSKEGLFSQDDWRSEVDNYAHWYLSGEFGRAYWDNAGRDYFDSEFSEYVDSVLEKDGIDIGEAWTKIASALPSKNGTVPTTSSICM